MIHTRAENPGTLNPKKTEGGRLTRAGREAIEANSIMREAGIFTRLPLNLNAGTVLLFLLFKETPQKDTVLSRFQISI